MSVILRTPHFLLNQLKLAARPFSCTSVLDTKQWRRDRGLPLNKNAEGMLTDGPDYYFLDGRPTPLLHKQKKRLLKHRDFATKIVELSEELDFAINREKQIKQAKEEERSRILGNRLKPKGRSIFNKS